MDGENAEFGGARVSRLLLESATRTAPEMRDAILMSLRAHTEGCPQSDDVTFITGVVL
jgi:serine phosphatase RsbU (regulator of sigma subunit)